MSQRNSGRERIPRDAYMTPAWVTRALVEDLEREGLLPVRDMHGSPLAIWEPAAGDGQMSGALAACGYEVFCTDIKGHEHASEHDFLADGIDGTPATPTLMPPIGAIITNPPYKHAYAFVDRALRLMSGPRFGLVAMLLKADWDSAGGRAHMFRDCTAWRRKIALVDRIVWVEHPDGKDHPSENHAWFVWQFRRGANGLGADLGYGGMPETERMVMRQRQLERRKAARERDTAIAVLLRTRKSVAGIVKMLDVTREQVAAVRKALAEGKL